MQHDVEETGLAAGMNGWYARHGRGLQLSVANDPQASFTFGNEDRAIGQEGEGPSGPLSSSSSISSTIVSQYHPVGSCKMGPDSDPMAVVDAQLRVKGVDGLRVADASIMPTLTGGNTNAASIMIGEKAADLIRASK